VSGNDLVEIYGNDPLRSSIPATRARSALGRAPSALAVQRAHASAIAAMDTLRPGIRAGSFAPWRAGGFGGNHRRHSSFMPAKSLSSASTTVALTILSRELSAA
jgi:hypothetical protein